MKDPALTPTSPARPSPRAELPVPVFEQATPGGTSAALFWRPKYLAESPWLEHLPALFWLAEAVRPRLSAVLGLADPVPYFGLCQAAERLGTGDCWGVAAGAPVAAAVRAHQAAEYRELGPLVEAGLEPAAERLEGRRIDLLVLALPLAGEAARLVESAWLPRLSERAVVAVAGLDPLRADPAGRALLARLGKLGPALRLEAGSGLLAVLAGESQPEPLARLATLDPGAPALIEARRVFDRLGQGCRSEWESRQAAAVLAQARDEAAAARAAAAAAAQAQAAAEARLAELEAAHAARSQALAALQAEHLALQQAGADTAAARDQAEAAAAAALAAQAAAEARAREEASAGTAAATLLARVEAEAGRLAAAAAAALRRAG